MTGISTLHSAEDRLTVSQRSIEEGFRLQRRRNESDQARGCRCAAGEDVVDASLAAQALRAGPCPLLPREREILAACSEGLSTAKIARRLWLSEGTVRNRVSEILGKLGARNRTEAAQIARENGWL